MLNSLRFPPWAVVTLLAALYAISLLDRQIIALIADPVAKSLSISDTQIGILYGLGFGVLYVLIGFPAAHYIDRNPRVGIVALGVLLWSACTIGSAFAATFLVLLILRSGVAIGEAVLTPAAVSMIGDMFPIEKRALPMAVYATAGGMMNTGSFFVGGAAYAQASQMSLASDMEPWRATLIIVGIPGIFLAILLWLFTREPARQAITGSSNDFGSVAAAISYVKTEAKFYLPFFVSIGMTLMVAAGFTTWTPTILIRVFDYSVATAGVAIGTLGMIVVTLGSFSWPLLAQWLTKSGRSDGLIIVFASAQLIGLVALALATLATTSYTFLFTMGITLFCMGCLGALPPLAIQAVAPDRMRGRISALHLLAATIGGVAIGPPLIAWISDSFFSAERALLSAGLIVTIVSAPIILGLMLSTRRRYADALEDALQRERAAR